MPRTHLAHMGRTSSGLGHLDHIPMVDEDLVADMDEPPERSLHFNRHAVAPSPGFKSDTEAKESSIRTCRSPSLLTQGLLTSPELRPMSLDTTMTRAHSTASNGSMISNVSTAELTSDGGLTSPARTSTPSPPLPSSMHTGLAIINSKTMENLDQEPRLVSHPTMPVEKPSEPAPPLRRRCITFACPQPKKEKKEEEPQKKDPSPPRKTCLKFACPTKPKREGEDKPASRRPMSPAPAKLLERRHRDSQSTIKGEKTEKADKAGKAERIEVERPADTPTPKAKKQTNPDGLRFHEFAAPRLEEEAWLSAAPTSRQKITVNDTLRKENAIRKIGEEAEEEALAEEEEEDEELNEELDDLDSEEDDEDDDEDDLDEDESDGNETDNEAGFADSEDESDDGSEYAFWTPANTTAATSVEHLEHIRPRTRRSASESSIESSINTNGVPIAPPAQPAKRAPHHKSKHSRHSPRMRPSTPELPDSTDFVCGTFDEDRPLEAAYLAMKEQRRIAKNGILPQDVDPSFPTSDPEQDDDDVLEEEDEADSDVQPWVAGKLEVDEETPARGRGRSNSTRQGMRKSPHVSPGKRAKSPAPRTMRSKSPAPAAKRAKSPAPRTMRSKSPAPVKRAKSPAPAPRRKSPAPPRRLFGRSPRRGPPPPLQHLPSPPSSRRNSVVDGGDDDTPMRPGRLAQRPHLTRTTSLPRTPNPFFHTPSRRPHTATTRHPSGTLSRTNTHTDTEDDDGMSTPGPVEPAQQHLCRGPIDIVQGLEHKRARRKEKFWRLHCRKTANQKPLRIGKGKGAERMRDVGLEMVERTRGYGQRVPLVLSV